MIQTCHSVIFLLLQCSHSSAIFSSRTRRNKEIALSVKREGCGEAGHDIWRVLRLELKIMYKIYKMTSIQRSEISIRTFVYP